MLTSLAYFFLIHFSNLWNPFFKTAKTNIFSMLNLVSTSRGWYRELVVPCLHLINGSTVLHIVGMFVPLVLTTDMELKYYFWKKGTDESKKPTVMWLGLIMVFLL
jgi:hypothetical protein